MRRGIWPLVTLLLVTWLLVACGVACGRVGFDPPTRSLDAPLRACPQLFCDDFEGAPLAKWTARYGPPDLVTVDANGRSGHGLHASGSAGVDVAAIAVDVFAPSSHEQWVRVYVRAPSGTTLDAEPVELSDPDHTISIVFALYDGDTDIHAHGVAGDFTQGLPIVPPRDVWSCYELHVVTAIAGRVELYRDGALLLDANVDTRNPATGNALTRLAIGFPSKAQTKVEQLAFDDVAVDNSRIGCM